MNTKLINFKLHFYNCITTFKKILQGKLREVVLHIGTQKTGTTSIQKCLKLNKDLLSSNSIFIPSSLDIGNGHHRWITSISNNDSYVDAFIANQQFKTQNERINKVRVKKDNFINEVEQISAGKWIIS